MNRHLAAFLLLIGSSFDGFHSRHSIECVLLCFNHAISRKLLTVQKCLSGCFSLLLMVNLSVFNVNYQFKCAVLMKHLGMCTSSNGMHVKAPKGFQSKFLLLKKLKMWEVLKQIGRAGDLPEKRESLEKAGELECMQLRCHTPLHRQNDSFPVTYFLNGP